MSEKTIKKAPRQSNFELLRIVAMVMIVTLHYLGKGKLLETEAGSLTYYFAYALETMCLVSVNIYVLISGYFMKSTSFKFNKILDLWIQTVVISFGAFIIARKTGILPEFKYDDFYYGLMPITHNSYWFITTYFVFCAIAPFLAKTVDTLDKKQHKNVCAVLVFLTSVLPTVFFTVDWLKISKGYHIVWFITLYFVASYIRKYDTFKKSPFVYLLGFVGFSAVSFILKFVIQKAWSIFSEKNPSDSFLKGYNMLFMFLASLFLFLAFKNIIIDSKIISKIIIFFSSTTLYVYLIHEAPAIRYYLWGTIVNPRAHMGFPDLIVNYIIGVGAVYIGCSLLGFIIKSLYSLLQLPKLTLAINKLLIKLTEKIMNVPFISKH